MESSTWYNRLREAERKVMNILFISHEGDSLGLAMRCQEEGHPTTIYLPEEDAKCIGDGLIEKPLFNKPIRKLNESCLATNTNELLKEVKPDLVVFDSIGYGKVAEFIREKGIVVFGSSVWSDLLVKDEDYSNQIRRRIKLELSDEYVVLWNGSSICASFSIKNEKRLMTGGLGREVESSGLIITSHLKSETNNEIEKILKRVKFRGVLSISQSFSSSLIYLFPILETYKGSVADFLFSIASGKKFEGEVTQDYALSLLISIPPYPYHIPCRNVNVGGINECNLKHLYLVDVAKPVGVYETTGSSGKVGWVAARGRSIKEARRRVYKTISNLSIDDVQYRMDIGEISKFNY